MFRYLVFIDSSYSENPAENITCGNCPIVASNVNLEFENDSTEITNVVLGHMAFLS